MLSKDIAKLEDIPEDECGVCYLHEKAYEKIENIIRCPHCKQEIKFNDLNISIVVVGEKNGYEENDKIEKMLAFDCNSCGKPIGFKTIPLIYNANHDIIYTGGKYYVTEEDAPKVSDEILKSIEQYTTRIKNGEKLEPWNLKIWIEYEMEHILAKWLYEHGYKE